MDETTVATVNEREQTFAAATDKLLIEVIGKARQRIVFVALGINEEVADVLGRRLSQENRRGIEVILDADPEVYRLPAFFEKGGKLG